MEFQEKKTIKGRILDYLIITVASFIYALAVSLFLDPNSLAPGGVTGIAIILNRLFETSDQTAPPSVRGFMTLSKTNPIKYVELIPATAVSAIHKNTAIILPL